MSYLVKIQKFHSLLQEPQPHITVYLSIYHFIIMFYTNNYII